MRELRKRINGLIALLLAVCMSLEISGGEVFAARPYTFGTTDKSELNLDTIKGREFAPGDQIIQGDSGGYFNVAYSDTESATIADYLDPAQTQKAVFGSVSCYQKMQFASAFPSGYYGIKVVGATETTDRCGDEYVKLLTYEWLKYYNLHFDANGGTFTDSLPDITDRKFDGVDSYTLNDGSALSRQGYDFKGWSFSSGGSGIIYQGGDTIALPNADITSVTGGQTLTLYAIWASNGESIPVGTGTTYLTAGQPYILGSEGVYKVSGDPTSYPMNTTFYVSESGNYTITVQ